jgi:hypothetical protein
MKWASLDQASQNHRPTTKSAMAAVGAAMVLRNESTAERAAAMSAVAVVTATAATRLAAKK